MIKYKDASKDQSSLIPLNTLFLDTLYVSAEAQDWPMADRPAKLLST